MCLSMQKQLSKRIIFAVGITLASLTSTVAAEGLSKSMVWTTSGVTSSSYAQAIAIGTVLKNELGISFRALPGKSSISRMKLLKAGVAGYCVCGIPSYFGQEGILQFATNNWGPQPLRALMTSKGSFGLGLAIAKDTGVKKLSDLKGKRVAWIRDSDALNIATSAFLAFGGLTWDDVRKVEFPDFKESIDGVIDGRIDTAFSSTVSSHIKRLAASPRGVTWPTLPPNDSAAWNRMTEIAPYFSPVTATLGAGISKNRPWIGAGYPFPILVANANQSLDEVYTLTKTMVEKFDGYKDNAPGAGGWSIDNQNFKWALPYHDGSVKYFKEIGLWSDAAQRHQEILVKRQGVLANSYAAYKATNPSIDEFKEGWTKARSEALSAANLATNFN